MWFRLRPATRGRSVDLVSEDAEECTRALGVDPGGAAVPEVFKPECHGIAFLI